MALLHGAIEDSDLTLNELRERGFPDSVLEALDCLTKKDGEAYEDYLHRVRANELARRVKMADLEDNMNLERIKDPSLADLERIQRYRRAANFLMRPRRGGAPPAT